MLTLIICSLFLTIQDSQPFEKIHNITNKRGQYVGTVFGRSVSDNLFSEIIVVNSRTPKDTLYRITKNGFFNSEGLDNPVVAKDYDGYKFEPLGPYSFTVFLVKMDGPSSDPATVVWNDSLRVFRTLRMP